MYFLPSGFNFCSWSLVCISAPVFSPLCRLNPSTIVDCFSFFRGGFLLMFPQLWKQVLKTHSELCRCTQDTWLFNNSGKPNKFWRSYWLYLLIRNPWWSLHNRHCFRDWDRLGLYVDNNDCYVTITRTTAQQIRSLFQVKKIIAVTNVKTTGLPSQKWKLVMVDLTVTYHEIRNDWNMVNVTYTVCGAVCP